jgi:hypothetical protein
MIIIDGSASIDTGPVSDEAASSLDLGPISWVRDGVEASGVGEASALGSGGEAAVSRGSSEPVARAGARALTSVSGARPVLESGWVSPELAAITSSAGGSLSIATIPVSRIEGATSALQGKASLNAPTSRSSGDLGTIMKSGDGDVARSASAGSAGSETPRPASDLGEPSLASLDPALVGDGEGRRSLLMTFS